MEKFNKIRKKGKLKKELQHLFTINNLSGNTRKQHKEESEKQTESFDNFFTTIGKILSNKLIENAKDL